MASTSQTINSILETVRRTGSGLTGRATNAVRSMPTTVRSTTRSTPSRRTTYAWNSSSGRSSSRNSRSSGRSSGGSSIGTSQAINQVISTVNQIGNDLTNQTPASPSQPKTISNSNPQLTNTIGGNSILSYSPTISNETLTPQQRTNLASSDNLSSPFTNFTDTNPRLQGGGIIPKNETTLQKVQRKGTELYDTLYEEEKQNIMDNKPKSPYENSGQFSGGYGRNTGYKKTRNEIATFTAQDKLLAKQRARTKIQKLSNKNKTLGVFEAYDEIINVTSGNIPTPLLSTIKDIKGTQNTLTNIEADLKTQEQEVIKLTKDYEPKAKAYSTFLSVKDLDKSTPEFELSETDYNKAQEMLNILEPERLKLNNASSRLGTTQTLYGNIAGFQESKIKQYNTKINLFNNQDKLTKIVNKLTPIQQATLTTGVTKFSSEQLAILPTQRATNENQFGALGAYAEMTLIGKKAFDAKYYDKNDSSVKTNQFALQGENLNYLGTAPTDRSSLLKKQRELEKFTINEYLKSDRSLENLGTIAQYTGSGIAIGGGIGILSGPAVVVPALIGGAGGAIAGVQDVIATEGLLYSTGDPLFAKTGGTAVGIGTGLLLAPLEGLAITKLTTPKILGIGNPKIVKSGLYLDDYIGAGAEKGLTKGTGRSLSIVEIPITTAGKKGKVNTVFKQFAVATDDKFFSGTGQAILAGGKKGTPKIVNITDDKLIKEATKAFYERGTNPVSTRLAREGLFIKGERNVTVFAMGEGKEALTASKATGLVINNKTGLLDTPFLNTLTKQGFFGKQKPVGITGKAKEFFQTKTGRIKKYKEDYFESFATEDTFNKTLVQQGDVTYGVNLVKKYDNADDLIGVGAYQTTRKGNFSMGQGKTFFKEGTQEVKFTSKMAKPTKTSVSKTTKQGTKSAGTDWMPTSGKPIGLGSKKAKPLSEMFPENYGPRSTEQIKDIARTEQDFIIQAKKASEKATIITNASQQSIGTAKKASMNFAIDQTQPTLRHASIPSFRINNYQTTPSNLFEISGYQTNANGSLTMTRTQPITQTQPSTIVNTQTITRPRNTYGQTLTITKPNVKIGTTFSPTITNTRLKTNTFATTNTQTLTRTIPKTKTDLMFNTKVKATTKTNILSNTRLKTNTSLRQLTGTRLKTGTKLRQATLTKSLLKTQTKAIPMPITNISTGPIRPPIKPSLPFGIPILPAGGGGGSGGSGIRGRSGIVKNKSRLKMFWEK